MKYKHERAQEKTAKTTPSGQYVSSSVFFFLKKLNSGNRFLFLLTHGGWLAGITFLEKRQL
jgi:hypothetical protein